MFAPGLVRYLECLASLWAGVPTYLSVCRHGKNKKKKKKALFNISMNGKADGGPKIEAQPYFPVDTCLLSLSRSGSVSASRTCVWMPLIWIKLLGTKLQFQKTKL
jgi:hypothetical protein